MRKSFTTFSWERGAEKIRRLTRSFDTLSEAERFAANKLNSEIYKSRGKYVVAWTKIINLD